MFIQTEATPNPATLKFLPGRDVLPVGTREFEDAATAEASPLARALFDVRGVTRVFFGVDFLTVTKAEGVEWAHIKPALLGAIMDHYVAGAPILLDGAVSSGHAAADDDADETTRGIITEIKELLDSRIRPAVAGDGGDITFNRFDRATGRVFLTLRGSCSGCPSSTATLKMGVENLLKHYVPEVTSVEAVA